MLKTLAVSLPRAKKVTGFFLCSLLGVTVDLSVFHLLVSVNLSPFSSNSISSCLAIIVTYLLVSRYTFAAAISFSKLLGFSAWYVCSIAFFSALIALMVHITALQPFLCKLISLPFSFGANYAFSRIYFKRSS